MKRIAVLGCGAVGRHMAVDLCKNSDYDVVSADLNREALDELAREYPIRTCHADLSTEDGVKSAVEEADIVIGSVPYTVGYTMLERVIRAGRNVVDISYFSEDPFGLDKLAKDMGVTAVVDCGVAPGMANIILGAHMQNMEVSRYECYVGGVPKDKNTVLAYKSPFPVLEVLEEYAESGRLVEDGKLVTRPMLEETMTIDHEKIGTMACLNSDGLRTLIHTADIPNMFEKTLRYPVHVDQMRILKNTGLLSTVPIAVGGVSVRPIDVTASLLAPLWAYKRGEADITVMKLVISGMEAGKPVNYIYDMYDEYDPKTGAPSMARTTGYTCNAVSKLVLEGEYTQVGISPPEMWAVCPGVGKESITTWRSEVCVVR